MLGGQFQENPMAEPQSGFIVKVKDPLVARLIRHIETRSNQGAMEYDSDSILERIDDPAALVSEALEEAIDQIIYLGGALSLLRDSKRSTETSETP
jgi:hypothetical protein